MLTGVGGGKIGIGVDEIKSDSAIHVGFAETVDFGGVAVGNGAIVGDEQKDRGFAVRGLGKGVLELAVEIGDADWAGGGRIGGAGRSCGAGSGPKPNQGEEGGADEVSDAVDHQYSTGKSGPVSDLQILVIRVRKCYTKLDWIARLGSCRITAGRALWYRVFMRIWAWCLFSMVFAGCDREPQAPPAAKPAPVLGVEIQVLTPLPPDRRTHLAPMRDGWLFWVQEGDGGLETVFTMSEGGLPSATTFSSATILEAMGENKGTGNIQSLAAGDDGKLYFYFTGGAGKRIVAAFGCYTPANGKTRIIADAKLLAAESHLGDSLALARGSVVLAGNTIWLWLRHDDGYALMSVDARQSSAAPRRPFARLLADGQEIAMTSPAEDLAATDSLVYLDRKTAKVWKIGPIGEGTMAADFSDLPGGISAPSADARGRMVLFAPEGVVLSELPVTRPSTVAFPALIILDGGARVVLGRKTFSTPTNLNVKTLGLRQMVRDRSGWVSYDSQSGEVLRLRVVER
jgi:hypothetical protein